MLRSVCTRKNCYSDARVNTDILSSALRMNFYRGWSSKHFRRREKVKISHRGRIDSEDAAGKKGLFEKK